VTAAAGIAEQTSLERWVADSRVAQGLPPRIESEDVLLRAAALVASALRRREEAGGHGAA
jgi:hypothetical protein